MNGTYIEASSANFDRGRNGVKPDLIIMHTMDGFFNGSISWFKNPDAKASAHFLIAKDGRICQMVPFEDTAWHAKNLAINRRSIGIEHEDERKPFESRPDSLYESSAQIVAEVAKKYSIPLDRTHVLKHSEVYAGKPNCPGGLDIDRIINRAKQIVGEAPIPPSTNVSELPTIIPHTRNVTVAVDKGLNVRSYPDSKLKNITRIIPTQTTFAVEGYCIAEPVNGNNIWWKLKNEVGFVWSGGTSVIPQPNQEPEAPQITPPAPATPLQTIDPAAAERVSKLEVDNKVLTDENKRISQNLLESDFSVKALREEIVRLNGELAKFGDLNFETVKNANEALQDQNKILMQKNKDLEQQRNDAFIQAFKGWKLTEVPEGPKGIASGLSFIAKVLKFNSKSHYVVGFKEGAKLYKVGSEMPAMGAQDVTLADLKGEV